MDSQSRHPISKLLNPRVRKESDSSHDLDASALLKKAAVAKLKQKRRPQRVRLKSPTVRGKKEHLRPKSIILATWKSRVRFLFSPLRQPLIDISLKTRAATAPNVAKCSRNKRTTQISPAALLSVVIISNSTLITCRMILFAARRSSRRRGAHEKAPARAAQEHD